jgi:hypothetical protein
MAWVNLRGLWRMEEADTALLDDSGEGNHLTGTWARTTTHQREQYAAEIGGELSRADASLSTNFPCRSGYSPSALTFGCTAWAQSAPADRMYIITKGGEYNLYFSNVNNLILFQCRNGGVFPTAGTPPSGWTINTPYRLVCRASTVNGILELFVNGVKQATIGTGLTQLAANSNPFVIGGNGAGGQLFDGIVDQAFMFDDLLSDADIAADFESNALFPWTAPPQFLDAASRGEARAEVHVIGQPQIPSGYRPWGRRHPWRPWKGGHLR